jgi:uncharacterized protein (TIGR00369 family)
LSTNINPFLKQISRTPHANFLNLKLVSAELTAVTLLMPYSDNIIGDPYNKIVHSGAITTLIDTACGAAIFQAQNNTQAMATLDLRVDYVSPAASGKNIQAYADCYKLTSTIAFVRTTVFTDDINTPIATAAATFMRSNKSFPIN